MPENIGLYSEQDHIVKWFVSEAGATTQSIKRMTPALRDGLVVSLTVNGVEVSFVRAVHELIEQYDEQVNQEARRIIDEEFEGLDNALQKALNAASELILLTMNRLKKERGW